MEMQLNKFFINIFKFQYRLLLELLFQILDVQLIWRFSYVINNFDKVIVMKVKCKRNINYFILEIIGVGIFYMIFKLFLK